jgi:hypothetical protein
MKSTVHQLGVIFKQESSLFIDLYISFFRYDHEFRFSPQNIYLLVHPVGLLVNKIEVEVEYDPCKNQFHLGIC